MTSLAGKPISQNGLGLIRLTWKDDVTPDEKAFGILKAALDAGVNVWNGADFYGTPDHNLLHLMNRYFTRYPEDAEKVVLTVKSGIVGMRTFTMDGSPVGVRNFVDQTVGALSEMVKEGKIGGIQLSEVGSTTIRRASAVASIDMVEAEIGLWATDVFENDVAQTSAELGIPMVAHTPLGAGMLTGQIKSLDDIPANDYHQFFPRFQPENFNANLQLISKISDLTAEENCTSAQLALSWIKCQSSRVDMPISIPVAGHGRKTGSRKMQRMYP
ncbi:aldo/keto reductase [Penicillium waksmanii]|uniref:aldo/keto reductase n=1 Tax=Penicillium waksmanii TaxID=69791 RepID=UPI0025468B0E|nr:aldo/keto reductase [Penicillium waksmanii]KAJ5980289.1 aldo/keto reductase [Penicillium waksmanii]